MRSILIGLFALAALSATSAEAMTVQPVVVDLKMAGRDMSAPIRVENNGPNPLPVEIRMTEAEFMPDGLKASDKATDDVLAFPPQALIPPGETQVFRLQYVGDPGADRSRHFYATVAQLPVQLPEGQSAIQILYNFQVMVNVGSTTGGAPKLTIENAAVAKNADGKPVAAFDVHNTGLNYGYLSNGRINIIERDGAGKEVFRKTLTSNDIQQTIGFGLVGPDRVRHFTSPVELPSADGKVEVSLATGRER